MLSIPEMFSSKHAYCNEWHTTWNEEVKIEISKWISCLLVVYPQSSSSFFEWCLWARDERWRFNFQLSLSLEISTEVHNNEVILVETSGSHRISNTELELAGWFNVTSVMLMLGYIQVTNMVTSHKYVGLNKFQSLDKLFVDVYCVHCHLSMIHNLVILGCSLLL